MTNISTFPYEALALKKYKSPHKNDLSFAKGDRIRVTSLAPKDDGDDDEDDDEDDQWLVGETLDGSKTGTFPAGHVEPSPATSSEPPVVSDTEDTAATAEADSNQDIRSPIEPAATATPKESEPAMTSKPDDAPQGEAKPAPTAAIDTQVSVEPKKASPLPKEPAVSPAAAEPQVKPSSPPVAAKPGGLAARIAAFNKPQEAPPPIPRGKPGGWKRPPPAPGAPKPIMPGQSPAQLAKPAQAGATRPEAVSPPASLDAGVAPATSISESVEAPQESQGKTSGFSAADAQSSIKMSLKERMAALQRGDDRSSLGDAAASRPALAPKPAPGKIAADRRNIAMAGIGAGAVREPSPSKATQADASDDKTDEGVPATTPALATDDPDTQGKSPIGEDGDDAGRAIPEGGGTDGLDAEQTEEEQENERRAAIAKRMAALGGRRVGGGPSIFGIPAPAPSPAKQVSQDDTPAPRQVKTEEVEDGGDIASTKQEVPTLDGEGTASPTKTLAVPRRAAPPRRKKGSASPDPPVAKTGSQSDAAVGDDATVPSTAEPDAVRVGDEEITELSDAAPVKVIAEGAEHLTEVPEKTADLEDGHLDVETVEKAPSSYGGDLTSDFEPGTPISQHQLDENARQLEAFVRMGDDQAVHDDKEPFEPAVDGIADQGLENNVLPGDEVESSSGADLARPAPPTSPPPQPLTSSSRPSSTVNNRPPSTRPPVPMSSIPAESVEARTSSPAPSRAPPVPNSARVLAEGDTLPEGEQDLAPATTTSTPAVVAAPKPRMAVAADLSDDEDETPAIDDTVQPDVAVSIVAAKETSSAKEDSDEEEERQRRARIAAKMSRMGGQPIMGAPLQFKRPSVPAPIPVTEREDTMEDTRGLDGSGDDVAAEVTVEDESEDMMPPTQMPTRAPSIPPVSSLPPRPSAASPPPPIPTKSPPPPRPGGETLSKRLSQMSTSEDSSFGRRGSAMSRPPVPSLPHSREMSLEEEDKREDEASVEESTPDDDDNEPRSPIQEASPIAAPGRAPPPPRAPPSPVKTRQGSVASTSSVSREQTGTSSAPVQRSSSQAPRSSRDLDLMPSSQWWRHGLPVKLPPTLLRPDAVPIVSHSDEGGLHRVRVDLIFEDYSSTVVEVNFQDDDADEAATHIEQRHNFAPHRPSTQELQLWSQQFGAPLARQATSALQSKGVVGDGSSRGFILALLNALGSQDVLGPVGSSFGSIMLAQAATTPVDVGADEIRAGDIIALHGTDFKGKKGLTPYHNMYGSAQEPTYACIIESEAKKRKLRCVLVAGVEAKRGSKGVEEISLRLDDVKSGLLRVFRLAPKIGWLSL